MKWYYVANARLPSEKAHGIQIAKMCEAFIEGGLDITLLAPMRIGAHPDIQGYYNLRVPVPVRFLPTIDTYTLGRVGYRLGSYLFMLAVVGYLWGKRVSGETFSVYTVDLDNFSSAVLPLAGVPVYSEMHGGKPDTLSQRFLFRNLRGVIAINSIIAKELADTFPDSTAETLVEPNGVDASQFYARDKAEARARLSLPPNEKIVLYAGRLFAWKGLEAIIAAAQCSPTTQWYVVGGAKEQLMQLTDVASLPDNITCVGDQPHSDMPYWIAAADVLVVLGTKRDQQSYWHTSPMKLFEYLLSERPIVASGTPAIREVVTEREVSFYEPDSAESLNEMVERALLDSKDIQEKIRPALEKGTGYSWQARAARIMAFIRQPRAHRVTAWGSRVLLGLCAGLVLFFTLFQLFESPETWMDEGLIIQSAQGLLHTGKA
ncbi:MAG: glycosyltransferase family 4 protein, partial [Patescibacteria group bacterium]